MASPKRDNARAARILVDAALFGDRKACETHKITDRTLRNYRAALDSDTELSALYAQLSSLVTTQTWAGELNSTLTTLIRKLGGMTQELPGSTAENIGAVTGAIKVLSEIAITREVLGHGEVSDAGDGQPDQSNPEAGGADSTA
ncbi:hypothetical protein [Deinococcus daejeonensis]|uniref:Uncharacterized protein n=1 Tax=Deinococcus daejeonensis TaxID=1007098 RepID=A0ABQ2JD90_9DEIO|nr:hypothetical protein [Deinococcus daejeonensis]GGN44187.1 hypothetical protein GCM10010842_32420 [Deinococcus daejeonensis]